MSTEINVRVDQELLLQRDRVQRQAQRQIVLEKNGQKLVVNRSQELVAKSGAAGGENRIRSVRTSTGASTQAVPITPVTAPYQRQPLPQLGGAAHPVAINAEFYIIEYGFTTGSDLDMRTFLQDPSTNQFLGPVGWCKDAVIPSTGGVYPIVWGGDNTGTGVEAVLFDRLAYKQLYPASKIAVLSLNGNWYNTKGDSVTIEVTGFVGGEMVKDGYTWTNETARKKWDKYAKHTSTSVYSNEAACIDGDFITYLTVAIDSGQISYSSSL